VPANAVPRRLPLCSSKAKPDATAEPELKASIDTTAPGSAMQRFTVAETGSDMASASGWNNWQQRTGWSVVPGSGVKKSSRI
jgi:hypothetical protein